MSARARKTAMTRLLLVKGKCQRMGSKRVKIWRKGRRPLELRL